MVVDRVTALQKIKLQLISNGREIKMSWIFSYPLEGSKSVSVNPFHSESSVALPTAQEGRGELVLPGPSDTFVGSEVDILYL